MLKKLSDLVPVNTRTITLAAKLDDCRALLVVQGLLTTKESQAVAARLNRRVQIEAQKEFHFLSSE